MRWRFLLPLLVALLGACASQPGPDVPAPSTAAPAPPPHSPPRLPARDAATAAAIDAVLASEHRSAGNRARDAQRHPLETLLFFGLKPDMTVVEVWPGAA